MRACGEKCDIEIEHVGPAVVHVLLMFFTLRLRLYYRGRLVLEALSCMPPQRSQKVYKWLLV